MVQLNLNPIVHYFVNSISLPIWGVACEAAITPESYRPKQPKTRLFVQEGVQINIR